MSFPTDNIKFSDVKNAFSLPNPVSMSNFYGLNIPGVPTSGTIAMDNVRGKTYATYILQSLSESARTACVGYYSLYRVSSSYVGPTFTIRRSSDNALTNVYSDINGVMGLQLNGTGTSLSSWLGGSTAYITVWYDQSPGARHASQGNSAIQPILNTTNMTINFRGNRYFNLPDGTVPYGNSSYTVSCKHGAIDNVGHGGILGSGTVFYDRLVNCFRRGTNQYVNYWWGVDLITGTYADNNACIWTYNGSQRVLYINGTAVGSAAASGRNSTAISNKIGVTFTELNEYLNGDLYYLQIFNTALDATDRAKLIK